MADRLTDQIEAQMKDTQGNLQRELDRIADLNARQAKDPLGNTGLVEKGYRDARDGSQKMVELYRKQLRQLEEQLKAHNPGAFLRKKAKMFLLVGMGALLVGGVAMAGSRLGHSDGRSPEFVPPPVPASFVDQAPAAPVDEAPAEPAPVREIVKTVHEAPRIVVVERPVQTQPEPIHSMQEPGYHQTTMTTTQQEPMQSQPEPDEYEGPED